VACFYPDLTAFTGLLLSRHSQLVLSGLESLTPSERRVSQLAADGFSNREIAQHLFITIRSVEGHLTHAYEKLAITSREQLLAALATPDVDNLPKR
jgi:DNA-binding CsgD family transcriptional regulator